MESGTHQNKDAGKWKIQGCNKVEGNEGCRSMATVQGNGKQGTGVRKGERQGREGVGRETGGDTRRQGC